MKFYKVRNVKTNETLLRYAPACEVLALTGMYATSLSQYLENDTIYKGTYDIKVDYRDEICEEWEKVCALFRGTPVNLPEDIY